MTLSDSESSDEDVGQADNSIDCEPNFIGATSSNEPHQMTQMELNNIGRDFNLDSFAPGL